MKVKFPRAKPHYPSEDKLHILSEISDILDSGMLTQGKHVKEFEDNFAKEIGTHYAIATNSCTSALQIAFESLEIKGKRVFVTTQTWMSSINAIILSGNTPVIIDIDPDTLCMDTKILKTLIDSTDGENTAILWVHMAGQISPDILEIRDVCRNRNVTIIEDCAHAHGASINGIKAGSIGAAGCFSFYPTKVMATGEGGMITSNYLMVNDNARMLRDHGTKRNPSPDGLDMGVTAVQPSQNFRMNEIAAIIGKTQLSNLNSFVQKRQEIAKTYRNQLSDVDGLSLLPEFYSTKHSYWNFYIILDGYIDRYKFAKILLEEYGIQTANAYDPPCHKQSIFKQYNLSDFPIADEILDRHISLPMYVELSEQGVNEITDSIKKVIKQTKWI